MKRKKRKVIEIGSEVNQNSKLVQKKKAIIARNGRQKVNRKRKIK